MNTVKRNCIVLIRSTNFGQIRNYFAREFTSAQLHPKLHYDLVELTQEGFEFNWEIREGLTKQLKDMEIDAQDIVIADLCSDALLGDRAKDLKLEYMLTKSLLSEISVFLDTFEVMTNVILLGPMPRRLLSRISCECNKLRIMNKILTLDALLQNEIRERTIELLTHNDIKSSEVQTPPDHFFAKTTSQDVEKGIKFNPDMFKIMAWYLQNIIIKITTSIKKEISGHEWDKSEKEFLAHWNEHLNRTRLPYLTLRYKRRTNVTCTACQLHTYYDVFCKHCSEYMQAHNERCGYPLKFNYDHYSEEE